MRVFAMIVCWVSISCSANAQVGSTSSNQQSPTELLQSANRLSTFIAADSAPWHLKATYTNINAEGKQTGTGTYEIFWAGPRGIRQSHSSKIFTQTDYISAKGVLRVGDMDWPAILEQRVPDSMFVRILDDAALQAFDPVVSERSILGQTLRCISLRPKDGQLLSSSTIVPIYCLDLGPPLLRYSMGIGRNVLEQQSATISNNFLDFRGHPIAHDVTVSFLNRPSLKIHVDVLEDCPTCNDSLFTPPTSAAPPQPKRHYVDQAHMEPRITKNVIPNYGIIANPTGFDGRGMLDVIIGKDGVVKNVRSIVGPAMYEQIEIHAVQMRRYQPFLADGVPVEVETEVAYGLRTR